MLMLVSYDVNTMTVAGKRRLRRVAKLCESWGIRVQNSVFECVLDSAQCKTLQNKLLSLMEDDKDSLRFYYLGNKYQTKIEHFGAKKSYEPEGVLMV